ncbi:MAG: hypothetical protein ACOYOP_00555 [Microthrixaceae bacterium]
MIRRGWILLGAVAALTLVGCRPAPPSGPPLRLTLVPKIDDVAARTLVGGFIPGLPNTLGNRVTGITTDRADCAPRVVGDTLTYAVRKAIPENPDVDGLFVTGGSLAVDVANRPECRTAAYVVQFGNPADGGVTKRAAAEPIYVLGLGKADFRDFIVK